MFKMFNKNKVNIQRVSGYDSEGKAIVSCTDSVDGKLVFKSKRIAGNNGADIVSSGSFRCEGKIGKKDLIEIDGEYVPFINVEPQMDFNGRAAYYIGWF